MGRNNYKSQFRVHRKPFGGDVRRMSNDWLGKISVGRGMLRVFLKLHPVY
jgi:hypothetical protein